MSQQEIEDLLELKGDYFIELASFSPEFDPADAKRRPSYWHFDDEIQKLVRELGDYHRFVIKSGFGKEVPSPDGSKLISQDRYELLVGPFDAEQVTNELKRLINSGYKTASSYQPTKTGELSPAQEPRLLMLYTKDRGPRFISGWLHLWFDSIEYSVSSKANKIVFHSINTYEGYRTGGPLFVADGNTGKLNPVGAGDFATQGFVLLPDERTVLVQRTFVLRPKEELTAQDYTSLQSYPRNKLNSDDLKKIAKQIGVPPNRLELQHLSEGSNAAVSSLFELDLQTDQMRSLRKFGGQGGLFMTQDGTIYFSKDYTAAYYRSQVARNERLGTLGAQPYYRFDLVRGTVTKMPDGFVPESTTIVQPETDSNGAEFKTLAQTGLVKLIRFKGIFYVQLLAEPEFERQGGLDRA